MKRFTTIRFLTYAVLIAIAMVAAKTRHFVDVTLEPQPFVPSADLWDWRGKNAPWLSQKLFDAILWGDDAKRLPAQEVDSGVRAILQKERPSYHGLVRRMRWTKDLGGWRLRQFDVYLVESDTGWIILAARTWEEQMTG